MALEPLPAGSFAAIEPRARQEKSFNRQLIIQKSGSFALQQSHSLDVHLL